MRTKTAALALALALAFGHVTAQEQSIDLIVLLDVSQSMFGYFNDVVDFVVTKVAQEYLRFGGDSFHLISFDDGTQVEVAQAVRTQSDLNSIVAQTYLLYPLGRNTDFVGALESVTRYVNDLPTASRKYILVITDGIHNPSDSNSNASLSPDAVRQRLTQSAGLIRENGWTLRIIKVPFSPRSGSSGETPSNANSASQGSESYVQDLANASGTQVTEYDPLTKETTALDGMGMPKVVFPGPLGNKGYEFTFPLVIENVSGEKITLELNRIELTSENKETAVPNILVRPVFISIGSKAHATLQVPIQVPASFKEGPNSLQCQLFFADGIRVTPSSGKLEFVLKTSFISEFFRFTGKAWLFILLLAVSIFLILLAVAVFKRLPRRAEKPVVDAILDARALEQERDRALSRGKTTSVVTANAPAKVATKDDARMAESATSPGIIQTASSLQTIEKASKESDELLRAFAAKDAGKNIDLPVPVSQNADDDILAAFVARGAPVAPIKHSGGTVAFDGKIRKIASIRLEFSVDDQNTNIGLRNIKTLQSGSRKTIGGGKSDFLVFLLPVPAHMAEIYFDGDDITIIPRYPELFPDYSGPIENCIDKKINFTSQRGFPMQMRFACYVPALEKINKLLHCIDNPGESD